MHTHAYITCIQLFRRDVLVLRIMIDDCCMYVKTTIEGIEERIHQYFITLARNSVSFWFDQSFTPELKSIGSTKGIYNYFFKEIPIFSSPQTVFFIWFLYLFILPAHCFSMVPAWMRKQCVTRSNIYLTSTVFIF